MSNQSNVETRTIADVRKTGLDKSVLERIAATRAAMERTEKEQKQRLPGSFLSLKDDKEERTFLFTGNWEEITKPAIDWQTKQEIPGRTVTRFRFQAYDITDPSVTDPPVGIFERGRKDAGKVLYHLSKGKTELTIMRNGARNSQTTEYDIYPASR